MRHFTWQPIQHLVIKLTHLSALAVLVATTLVATASTARADPPGPASDWKKVFDDEFDGSKLDTTKWTAQWTWPQANGTFINSDSKGGNTNGFPVDAVSVHNDPESGRSVLDITLQRRPYTDSQSKSYDYTSGVISTGGKERFRYGYFEAKIKLPVEQMGTDAGFWLAPSIDAWPPEIDIAEFPGNYLGKAGSVLTHSFHYGAIYLPGQSWASSKFLCAKTCDNIQGQWHVYGADWEPDYIAYYMDGKELYRTSNDMQVQSPNLDMHIYLSFETGFSKNWTGSLEDNAALRTGPEHLLADYVRVWQRANPVLGPPPANIVNNDVLLDSSFEQQSSEQVGESWKVYKPVGGLAQVSVVSDPNSSHSGQRSVKISSNATTGFTEIFQTVDVVQNTNYVLSAWVRSRQTPAFAGGHLGVQVPAPPYTWLKVTDWNDSSEYCYRKVDCHFNSGNNSTLTVFVGYTPGEQPSWMLIDDVTLTPDTPTTAFSANLPEENVKISSR